MRELTLMIPGLFGLPGGAARDAVEGLRLDALEQLLARADRSGVCGAREDLETALVRAFGLRVDPARGPAIAPLARLGETGERRDGWWLRADPVHIEAGLDRAVMTGPSDLDISRTEADELSAELNAGMAEEGLQVDALAPGRWYAPWPDAPRVRLAPLAEALGDNLFLHVPDGDEGRPWRVLLNHAQMVLHGSAVNARRRAAGRPEVNALWFWGAGELPDERPAPFAAVWGGDDPLLRGLALNGGRPFETLPQTAEDWLAAADEGGHLVVLDDLREPLSFADVEAWRARLDAMQRDWIVPLRDALHKGALGILRLCPGDGCGYHVSRRAIRRRWWRRPRPLASYSTAP